jgi:hypothetical protein
LTPSPSSNNQLTYKGAYVGMTGTFAKPTPKGGEPGRRTEMSKTVIGLG